MLTSIGSKTYSYTFRHDPSWKPDADDGLLHVPKQNGHEATREVRGRTVCTISEVQRDGECPRHGRMSMSVLLPTVKPAPDVRCTCRRTCCSIGTAYCSVKDHFDEHAGRKHAFRRAVESFSRVDRGVFWKSFLLTCPQIVMVPRHPERRRVMSE